MFYTYLLSVLAECLGVSWTNEITVDDLYSKCYLQNYIRVMKKCFKMSKSSIYDHSTSVRSQVRLLTDPTLLIPR